MKELPVTSDSSFTFLTVVRIFSPRPPVATGGFYTKTVTPPESLTTIFSVLLADLTWFSVPIKRDEGFCIITYPASDARHLLSNRGQI